MTRFERWSVWLSTGGTLITGVVYWWMKDVMTSTDPWSVINHPFQPWVLKAHILIAPFLVFSVGLITSRHIWRHFRMGVGTGRRSGLIAAVTFLVLVVSGYLIQVVTGEAALRALAWTHLGLGIVYSAGVAVHWPATRTRSAGNGEARRGTHRPRPGLEGGAVPVHDRRRRGLIGSGGRPRARPASGD